MESDEQDIAEAIDEEVLASDPVTSDEFVGAAEFPPDHLSGVPFADADVTDESLEDRLVQEEPEVWEDEGLDADGG